MLIVIFISKILGQKRAIEENIYIRLVCEGVTDARLYNMKLTEALHSVHAIYLGLPIFNYDAKFMTARHSV